MAMHGQLSAPSGERASDAHCTAAWVGLTAGLEAMEKRTISCPCQQSSQVSSVVHPVVQSSYRVFQLPIIAEPKRLPFFEPYVLCAPITVAGRSKALTVFARSNTGIVGSNPTQDMNVCVYCVCAGIGLATG
jgi:hypothetical protein